MKRDLFCFLNEKNPDILSFLEKLLFPNGLDIIPRDYIKKEFGSSGSFYLFTAIVIPNKETIKKQLEEYSFTPQEMNSILDLLLELSNSFLNNTKNEKDLSLLFFGNNFSRLLILRDTDLNGYEQRIFFFNKNRNRLTLDDLLFIKPNLTKTFFRKSINKIDLEHSSTNSIMNLLRKNKIDYFRLLGVSGIQFSKKNLKEIINLPEFSKEVTSGLFAADGETRDMLNRRTIILYQGQVDKDIFLSLLDNVSKASQASQENFFKTIKRKSVREKFENLSDDIRLWYKFN